MEQERKMDGWTERKEKKVKKKEKLKQRKSFKLSENHFMAVKYPASDMFG
jgi:hypothetical protein